MRARTASLVLSVALLASTLAVPAGGDGTRESLRVSACVTPSAPSAATVEVLGRVTHSGRGVADVSVVVFVDGEPADRTTTSNDGWFSTAIDPGSAGDHRIRAEVELVDERVHLDDNERTVRATARPLASSPVDEVRVRSEDQMKPLEVRPACEWVFRPAGSSKAELYVVLAGQAAPSVPLLDPDGGYGPGNELVAQVYAEKAHMGWECPCPAAVDGQARADATVLTDDDPSYALAVGPFTYADAYDTVHHAEDCSTFLEVEHEVQLDTETKPRVEGAREDLEICG